MISFLSPIEKPYEIYQERILCEGSYKVCECSGGVVAIFSQYGCTVRSSIAAFRVADPGFKSRPEHPFSYSSASFGLCSISTRATLESAVFDRTMPQPGQLPMPLLQVVAPLLLMVAAKNP